jgi:hypothetical protein
MKRWSRKELLALKRDPDVEALMVEKIAAILHGHNPQEIGLVLGELVAMWLIGHQPPNTRDEMWELWTELVCNVRRHWEKEDERDEHVEH